MVSNVNKYIAENTIVDMMTPHRQKFHISAPIGLINDPNGFSMFRGKYYLFYQTYPFKAYHGKKYWAQLVSDNLVHWEYKGIVLEPEYWFEEDGCFSGNIFVQNDRMYLFYTGNLWKKGIEFEVGEEYQCLAISDDGEDFQKLKEPIIGIPDFSMYTPHHRDPKVWKHNDRYYMIVAAQTIKRKPTLFLYYSQDLLNWKECGPLLNASEGEYSKAYMWECPGYCSIANKDVLFICPQGMTGEDDLVKNRHQSGYLIGDIDYQQAEFNPSQEYQLLDYGFEFYAPQVFTDDQGRHLCIGWMGLPDGDDHPTVKDGWLHCLTLPTELTMKGNKLYRKPVKELEELRKDRIKLLDDLSFNLESFELLMELEKDSDLDLYLRSSKDMSFYIKFSYNSKDRRIILDRSCSRYNLKGCREIQLDDHQKQIKLDIFVDKSSIEVFINNGEYVLTSRIFTDKDDKLNKVSTTNNNVISNIYIWEFD